MVKKLKVVYWNNIPAPYIVDRFNALVRRGNVDFEAWFNDRREPDRSWAVDESTWEFSYRFLPTVSIGRHRLHVPVMLLGKEMPDFLVSLYAQPSFIMGWMASRLRKRHIAFWAQVTHDSWVSRRRWKEALKAIMFRRIDAALGSGEDSRKFAIKYGTSPDRALVLQHSIDVEHFRRGALDAAKRRKDVRAQLGLEGVTFIYVGRLWSGKGLVNLLDAFCEVQGAIGQTSLLLIGDGPQEEELKRRVEHSRLRNVVFAGFKDKEALPEFYAAADIFVFPTLGDPYGLVVDEALASGLPVISTDAAGEIRQRIDDGVNGYIVSAGYAAELVKPMLRLAADAEALEAMRRRCRSQIRARTPEQWAAEFEAIIGRIVSTKPA